MQELRLVMIVLGAVAIVALLLHGLWTTKKERPAKFAERPIRRMPEKDSDGFDQDGIGSVRVVKSHLQGDDKMPKTVHRGAELSDEDETGDALFTETSAQAKQRQNHSASHSFEQQTRTKAAKGSKDFYHFEDTEEDIALAQAEQTEQVQQPQPQAKAPAKEQAPLEDVLVINVQARNNQEFSGEDLFNCLEQFGMHFGEMDIFHHPMDDSPKAESLFCAANMFNPGTFPVKNLHQFSTSGITFFMRLPCSKDAEQTFKLMLKTAQQIADQLGGLVTDDSRNMLTPQQLDRYRDKIKLFAVEA